MNTKYTKGPWTLTRQGDIVSPDGKRVVLSNFPIAFSCTDHSEESKANGALLLAAPMLAEALEALLDKLSDIEITNSEVYKATVVAETALAAVRGDK